MSTALPTSDEHELLVKWLAEQLAVRAELRTSRIMRDCRVQGRATRNQIDVLWDFTDAAGRDHRVVFEARSYQDSIKQGALHAFRSVVDDIQVQARAVTGVMVTTAGYQQGAHNVASTYGLIILELRQPTVQDVENRVSQIVVDMTPKATAIQNVTFDTVQVLDGRHTSSANGHSGGTPHGSSSPATSAPESRPPPEALSPPLTQALSHRGWETGHQGTAPLTVTRAG